MSKRTLARLLAACGVVAALAVGVWTWIAWGWVTATRASPVEAALSFEAARLGHAADEPIVTMRDGAFVRRPPPEPPGEPPSELLVLVYRRPSERLIRADVPFWFLQMKGPPSERVLRGAGIDLAEFGLTVADLARYGPALIFDGTRGEDRVLLVTR